MNHDVWSKYKAGRAMSIKISITNKDYGTTGILAPYDRIKERIVIDKLKATDFQPIWSYDNVKMFFSGENYYTMTEDIIIEYSPPEITQERFLEWLGIMI